MRVHEAVLALFFGLVCGICRAEPKTATARIMPFLPHCSMHHRLLEGHFWSMVVLVFLSSFFLAIEF